jgi:hypothetical protein
MEEVGAKDTSLESTWKCSHCVGLCEINKLQLNKSSELLWVYNLNHYYFAQKSPAYAVLVSQDKKTWR